MTAEEARAFVAVNRHTIIRDSPFVQWPYYIDVLCESPLIQAVVGGLAVGQTLEIVIDLARYVARSG
jgi:hypothetical protein